MLSVIRPNDIMTICIMRSEFCLKDVMSSAIIRVTICQASLRQVLLC
jgi:hypothetical protein